MSDTTNIEGSRNDVAAWASDDGKIVLHPRCRNAYFKHTAPVSLNVFIHDRRSEYIGRFQCCAQCGKAI